MKKIKYTLLAMMIALLTLGTTASAKYNPWAVYKSHKVQVGVWAYDGSARYTWYDRGHDTVCEVLVDDGSSYYIDFYEPVSYESGYVDVEIAEPYNPYQDEYGNWGAYEEDCVLYAE